MDFTFLKCRVQPGCPSRTGRTVALRTGQGVTLRQRISAGGDWIMLSGARWWGAFRLQEGRIALYRIRGDASACYDDMVALAPEPCPDEASCGSTGFIPAAA